LKLPRNLGVGTKNGDAASQRFGSHRRDPD
jgi:hypothetical protein